MRITVTTEGTAFRISAEGVPKDSWERYLMTCKALPGASYDRARRSWLCCASHVAADKIVLAWGEGSGVTFKADEGFARALEGDDFTKRATYDQNAKAPPVPGEITPSWTHQRQAYWFARDREATLLNMDMGTGKSKVVVDLVTTLPLNTVLILCPKSVQGVWREQFERHAKKDAYRLITFRGKKLVREKAEELRILLQTRRPGTKLVVVMNYDAARSSPMDKMLASETEWDLVVCDESQRLKTHSSKLSKFCEKLRARAKKRLCLTGTPMAHSPLDIFGQYRFLDQNLFGSSYYRFKLRYAVWGGYAGRQILRFQKQDEMREIMSALCFTARASEVLDLPEAIDRPIKFDLGATEQKVYDEMEKDFITDVQGGHVTASNALVRLLRLQQITGGHVTDEDGQVRVFGKTKREMLGEQFDEIDWNEDRAVVFCRFSQDVNEVQALCEQKGLETIEVSGKRNDLEGIGRWRSIDSQTGNENVAVVQIQAGGLGIDLTVARYCFFYSVGFSMGDYLQARARVHRPGQKKSVVYVPLVATRTVDEKVYKALKARKEVVGYILDGLQSSTEPKRE